MRQGGRNSRESTTRIIGWVSVLSVVVLSLVPGRFRPHVLPSNHEEHFIAYVVVGSFLGISYPALRQRLILGIMLAIGAALLEAAQLFIVGRTSSVEDFVASAMGAWTGLLLSSLAQRLLDRGSKAA
jgi:hypothetical protein